MESFLYLLIILVVLMVAIRFFIPLLEQLIPILFIAYLIGMLVKYIKGKKNPEKDDVYEENYTYQDYQSNQSDVIDVDYKVIHEEEDKGEQYI